MLIDWIKVDPSLILQKARLQNTATPMSEYLRDLEGIIRSTFKRSCCSSNKLSIHSERVILRYVVYMQIQIMDRKTSNPASPLACYRNPDTPIEQSVASRQCDGERPCPSLTVLDQLKKSSCFFTTEDRIRVRSPDGKINSTAPRVNEFCSEISPPAGTADPSLYVHPSVPSLPPLSKCDRFTIALSCAHPLPLTLLSITTQWRCT
jgi:hypothetical protein